MSETEGMRFKWLSNGLYRFDTTVDNLESILSNTHTSFFSTVVKNKEYFSHQEIKGAEKECEIQDRVGWPSDQQFNSFPDEGASGGLLGSKFYFSLSY